MTAPPLPTFVPQDAWYNITTGNVNPSVADTVPDITYLRPSVTALGTVDGLIGPLDGAIVGLAGDAATLDGGQKWLMWDEDSLLTDDGVNVFNPNAVSTTPGRWRALATPSGAGIIQTVQSIQAGQSTNIAASAATFVQVFVTGTRLANIATTLALPAATFTGQTISVKDALGDATTYNIIITAANIDDAASFTLVTNYQEIKFTWNGSSWSVT